MIDPSYEISSTAQSTVIWCPNLAFCRLMKNVFADVLHLYFIHVLTPQYPGSSQTFHSILCIIISRYSAALINEFIFYAGKNGLPPIQDRLHMPQHQSHSTSRG